jgi:hypothetical protein
MTGKTRCFWLLSDHKTVREVDFEIININEEKLLKEVERK